MAATVLLDPTLDARLRDDGYVIAPVLSPDEVADLRSAYRALVPDLDTPGQMEFDYMAADRSMMRAVWDLVAPVWDRHLPELFVDHEPVFATFVCKHPGPVSGMFLHDDRTYLDERRQRAFTIWVPLVDVSPELDNGTLYLVPGSHRVMTAFSGTNTPDWIRPYEEYLERFLEPVRMTAGEALVYDTKTVHGSTPNRSATTREAIATAVAPRGAELIHVVADGDRRRVYRIDREFFFDVHPHAVAEHGVPERYPLIEEFVERQALADPAAVAAVGDPTDVPTPQDVVPGIFRQPLPPGERERLETAPAVTEDLAMEGTETEDSEAALAEPDPQGLLVGTSGSQDAPASRPAGGGRGALGRLVRRLRH